MIGPIEGRLVAWEGNLGPDILRVVVWRNSRGEGEYIVERRIKDALGNDGWTHRVNLPDHLQKAAIAAALVHLTAERSQAKEPTP